MRYNLFQRVSMRVAVHYDASACDDRRLNKCVVLFLNAFCVDLSAEMWIQPWPRWVRMGAGTQPGHLFMCDCRAARTKLAEKRRTRTRVLWFCLPAQWWSRCLCLFFFWKKKNGKEGWKNSRPLWCFLSPLCGRWWKDDVLWFPTLRTMEPDPQLGTGLGGGGLSCIHSECKGLHCIIT